MSFESSNDCIELNKDLISSIANLLDVDADDVRRRSKDTFIELGGDSVRALQLTFQFVDLELEVVLGEKNSIRRLSEILEEEKTTRAARDPSAAQDAKKEAQTVPSQPFQLIDRALLETVREEASQQIGCSISDIEDILPVTDQQKLLWIASLQQSNVHISHWCFNIHESIDVQRFQRAWEKVLESSSVLRARFILSANGSLHQAIAATKVCKHLWKDKEAKSTAKVTPDYGKPLFCYGMDLLDNQRTFHIYSHHAVWDRWSTRLVLDDLRRAYQQGPNAILKRPSFIPFLVPLPEDQKTELCEKWAEFIGRDHLTPVPCLSRGDNSKHIQKEIEAVIEFSKSYPQSETKAELILTAWSWLCSKHARSSNISFGIVVSGRDVPIPEINEMTFPTLSALPFCVNVSEDSSRKDLLSLIKSKLSTLRKIQRLGVIDISSINDACRKACQYNSIVVVQSEVFPPTKDDSKLLRAEDLVLWDIKQGHPLVFECTPTKNRLSIRLIYDSEYLSSELAKPMLSHLVTTIQMFAESSIELCKEMNLFNDGDREMIGKWTRHCEKRNHSAMYSMIVKQAKQTPEALAIWTTQGTMTYGQLIACATAFAKKLGRIGDRGHIGACFEHSSLSVVAQIGISMSGNAFIPMEPSNPIKRLEQVAETAHMSLLVCSKALVPKFKNFPVSVFVLDEELLKTFNEPLKPETIFEEEVHERNAKGTAYIVFTSGSTGKPKGVVIQHEQISTSLSAQRTFFNVNSKTRTLQFASLAFDMSIHEIYMTLTAGGTVCIPSEEERFELDEFLAMSGCNYSMLTPSVVATLSDSSLAQIGEIALGGEPLPKGLIDRILKFASRLWVTYGPTETTILNLAYQAYKGASRFNLGYVLGATAWIVDTNDPHRLAPVGIPGELAFSGYTLAKEYYKDPKKSGEAFRKGLEWAKSFPEHSIERVYLTGDLASYNADGTIQFIGRLGGFTKIAGNRVDLDEIVHVLVHKCELSNVSVQSCRVNGSDDSRNMLLCFYSAAKSNYNDDCKLIKVNDESRYKIQKARAILQERLPSYMVPSAFLLVSQLPLNTSGKLDNSALRNLVSETKLETLLDEYGAEGPGSSIETCDSDKVQMSSTVLEYESVLKESWSKVLAVSASGLHSNSHFTRAGGSSLRAMELTARLRSLGLSLTIADIFETPILREMAGKVRQYTRSKGTKEMFGSGEYSKLVHAAADTLGLHAEEVENVSLCSSIQIQMLVASERAPGVFLHRDSFLLDRNIQESEVRNVCRALTEQNELLRTKIYTEVDSGRFLQAVIKTESAFLFHAKQQSLVQYMKQEKESIFGLTTPLVQFTLLSTEADKILVWEMHHCIFDGYSRKLLLEQLHDLIGQSRAQRLHDAQLPTHRTGAYHNFIQFLNQNNHESMRSFWSKYLDEAQEMQFNILKPTTGNSRTTAQVTKVVTLPWRTSQFTKATYVRAAFALLLSRYAASNDVNFAVTLSGRDLPVEGIQELAGPTFATLPARIIIDPKESMHSLLTQVQQDFSNCAEHQTLGLQDISRISAGCKHACRFQTHLLIQPQELTTQHVYDALSHLGYRIANKRSSMQLQIPFNLVVTLGDLGMDLEAIFNDESVESGDVHLILDQFETLLRQLIENVENPRVSDLFKLGPQNLKVVKSIQPQKTWEPSTIPDLVFQSASYNPENEAIYCSGLSLTYGNLYGEAQIFGEQIRRKTLEGQQAIAFCFEKSASAIVAQLAILISGNAYVPVDPLWPDIRCSNVFDQAKASLLITSPKLAERFHNSGLTILTFQRTGCANNGQFVAPKVETTDTAYILFTSGSSGTPKGVVIEHGAISQTVLAHAELFKFNSATRALLFASFTFDASVIETWAILASGGTLCVPSDEERIADLNNFLQTSKTAYIGLTPTVARFIDPTALNDVKTILFCGEKCRESDRARWQGTNVLLANGYGPTEASVNVATNMNFKETDLDDVGMTLGSGLWIVSPENAHELLPINCTGELAISGPALAREYLNNPELTAERFFQPRWPEWTKVKRAYLTGDLARLDGRGRLHICGRNDAQMKVNGIRIESGEIEGALRDVHTQVKDVVAGTFSVDGITTKLVLYFALHDSISLKSSQILPLEKAYGEIMASLQAAAKEKLPTALVPTFYIPVTSIPQGISGKVDRKALEQGTSVLEIQQLRIYQVAENRDTMASDLPWNSRARSDQTQPTDTEKTMESLWFNALNLDSSSSTLNSQSDFIEIGGDSIAVMRLRNLAASKGIHLPIDVIISKSKLEEMASAVDEIREGKRRQDCQSI